LLHWRGLWPASVFRSHVSSSKFESNFYSAHALICAFMQPHRKQIKHFHEPGDFHELTFSCHERSPLLMHDEWPRLLCEAIDRANSAHEFALVAFVLMPEHVHLLVFPRDQAAKHWRPKAASRTRRIRDAWGQVGSCRKN
jgi:REP element-mobilizing transposase RayT